MSITSPLTHAEGDVRQSLDELLHQLDEIRAGAIADAGLSDLVENGNYDPLTFAEMITLGCGWMLAGQGENFSSADVLDYVLDHLPRPLALSVIYRSFSKLTERGLIEKVGTFPNRSTNKPADFFSINTDGRRAFLLALINHLSMTLSRSKAA